MKIIRSLTLRNLRLNPQRTLVTIIGVILSVALITTVPTFVASFHGMLVQEAMIEGGNWHVRFEDVAEEDMVSLVKESDAVSWGSSQDFGYAELEGSKNAMKPYLFVTALDEGALQNFYVTLKEGRLPEAPDEVVISDQILENSGVKYAIGDVLTLDLGQRAFSADRDEVQVDRELPAGRILGQEDSLYFGEQGKLWEELIPEETRVYTVTGIISRPAFEGYSAPGYTVITAPDPDFNGSRDMHLTWNSISEAAMEEAESLGRQFSAERVRFNETLLRYYGIMSENNLNAIYGIAALVTALIMVSSVALIFNSFAISIAERSRQMGLLASTGATRQQKAGSVLFEGFLVAAIGIPLGILLGLLGLGLTFRLISPILKDLIGSEVQLKLIISPLVILISLVVSAVTVFLSALLPALRASRISAMDAIRQNRDVKLTRRSVKTSRLTRRIFGFEAELGLKNLKRNKNRYRITVISLVVSLTLFLTVSAITHYSRKQLEFINTATKYNVTVSVTSDADATAKKAFYEQVMSLDGVDEPLFVETLMAAARLLPDEIMPELHQYMHLDQGSDHYNISVSIQSLDEVSLEAYARAGGVDPDSLKDPADPRGILVNTVNITDDGKTRQLEQFDLGAGDSIKILDPYSMDETHGMDLTIAAIQDHSPIHENRVQPVDVAEIIVSDEVYLELADKRSNEFFTDQSELKIMSSAPYELVEQIREYQTASGIGALSIRNQEETSRTSQQYNLLVSIFFYGFVGLFAAISIANIFNTISTGVNLRKAEFAALKSVGMTPQGFRRMIRFESLFYAMKALLYGLPLSLALIYLVYRISQGALEQSFTLPWTNILIGILAVFLLVGLTMSYSAAKLKDQNIVEVLKNENI